jgi:4-amino-4-deoxy-L-arabinose transferase-like glycosyltransferase
VIDPDTRYAVLRRFVRLVLPVIAIVWLAMSLTYPFGWDQGLFAWVGGAIVDGGLPYRDAWDFKGPLVYYTFALGQWIFGIHLWSIRVLDAVLLIASAMAVRRVAAALTDPPTARWSSLIYVLWYASHSYWHTAQPDGWTGMLLILGVAPLIARPNDVRWSGLALAGACVGLTTLLKPPAAAFLVVPLVIAGTSASRRAASAAVVVIGWLVPVCAAAAWFALRGALPDLIDVHLRYSATYVALSPGGGMRDLVVYLLSSRVVSIALPLVTFGALVLWRTNRSVALALAAWSVVVLVLVALQNRFYAYQWLPMLPAWTLLGSAAIYRIQSKMKSLAIVMTGAIVVHCIAPIAVEEARFVAWLSGGIDTTQYYDAYGESGHDMRAVQWLQEQGEPGPIFVFGWHSTVAWLSGRDTVSRFGYSLPLMLGPDGGIKSAYRAEAMRALAATPPRYIVVGAQSERILGTRETLDDFPELAELVRTDFREAIRFNNLRIYERAR